MALNNKEIYKKTIGFSIRKLGWDTLAVLIFIAFAAGGFLIANAVSDMGVIGLVVGMILAGIVLHFLLRYAAYSCQAGQIAMMVRGVTEGELPSDVIGEGKKVVKERFSTVAGYYVVTSAIKGIFNQIGYGITKIGEAVGGKNGGAVGSTISAGIQVAIGYLCDCCLGWVFYRKDEKAPRATCEGAVIFFKHGKTLLRNVGRMFGMGTLSFVLIGGAFFGIFYLILMNFPDLFTELSAEMVESAVRTGNELPEFMRDINSLMLLCSGIAGVVLWGILHSTFVRPFILVGVLRNFMKSGMADRPTDAEFSELDKKSKKFKKLHEEVEAGK